MAKKEESEIALGTFIHTGSDADVEARLSEDSSVSTILTRKKGVIKQLERGASYEVVLRKQVKDVGPTNEDSKQSDEGAS
jgi:hypothetical protein